mgnify:CR=1 FL=1|tara:strand:- start:409 stop:2064 length:1656 start_codon:yes stop_codon:yes gene_type:complete
MKNKIKIISDFNIDVFYNLLSRKINKKKYNVSKPNFGLFHEKCFDLIKSKNKNRIVFIWSRIEGVIKSFNSLLLNEKMNLKILYKEVDQYINILKQLAKFNDNLIVTSWAMPNNERGKYLNDFTDEFGLTKNINEINTKIATELKSQKNFKFLNIDFLIKQNFTKFNPKLWYAAKVPFSQDIFEIAVKEFIQIIESLDGKNKKLIVLDLDNTLWGGILGDLGWKNINIGGHNIHGEAFRDFQSKLKSLKNLGIQLAICSKNYEKDALEAIEKNSNMILKKRDFAAWKINWDDKAKNIKEIISELNLTNDAVVFIDDNKIERERVRRSLKGVTVPDWPEDPTGYVGKLQSLGYFNGLQTTYEDKNRTKFYQDEKIRKKNMKSFISYDKWLQSLKTKVYFEKGNEKNKKRILQLINKTNQMNLTTRRITEANLDKLIKDKTCHLLSCKVKDKFGDMGLVGVVSFKLHSKKIEVIDFILSCRAFGRSIEKSMLMKIIEILKKKNFNEISFKYLKTKKNRPCLEFLNKNLKKEKNNVFVYKKNSKFDPPKFLNII